MGRPASLRRLQEQVRTEPLGEDTHLRTQSQRPCAHPPAPFFPGGQGRCGLWRACFLHLLLTPGFLNLAASGGTVWSNQGPRESSGCQRLDPGEAARRRYLSSPSVRAGSHCGRAPLASGQVKQSSCFFNFKRTRGGKSECGRSLAQSQFLSMKVALRLKVSETGEGSRDPRRGPAPSSPTHPSAVMGPLLEGLLGGPYRSPRYI